MRGYLAAIAAAAIVFSVIASARAACNDNACTDDLRAATVEQRLKTLEKKTGYFDVKRMKKSKTFGKKSFTLKAELPEGLSGHWMDIAIASENPVETYVWLEVLASYTSTVPFEMHLQVGLANPHCTNCYYIDSMWCRQVNSLPAPGPGTQSVNFKAACKGVVNAQNGDKLRVGALFVGEEQTMVVLESMTINARLINEVMVEFE